MYPLFCLPYRKYFEKRTMTYKSYWRKQSPAATTSLMSLLTSRIKSSAKAASQTQAKGGLVQIRLTPHGWDDAAYLVIEEAAPKSKRFKVLSEQRFTGDDADRQAIDAYWQVQERLLSPECDAATPLFCENMGLFPEDLANARPKTADELRLDQAQLCLEIDEFDAAENWLKQVSEEVRENSMFGHTVARRLYMNWSLEPSARADALRELAIEHAVKLTGLYKQLELTDQYAAQRTVYFFGDHYDSAGKQVSLACQTLASSALEYYNRPDIALNYCEYGEATNYGGVDLYRLKIQALLKLNRTREAWDVFSVWQSSLGDMPEVTESADYQQFIAKQTAANTKAEQKRLADIRISYTDAAAAEEDEIENLRQRFPKLGDRWLTKLRDGRQAILHVKDGDISSSYRRLLPRESIDAHAEMLTWIHLHDNNPDWPELAAERDAALKESGIDPEQMLPIIGGESTPDCYLLRLDGDTESCGAVYLWSHEESANFEKIVDDIDDIFPYLADCGTKGIHCL